MSGSPFTPAQQASFDEQQEQLESLPVFRDRWPETNTKALEAARLPTTNPIVLGLPPPTVRLYIRALASSRSFRCDVLDRSVLVNEPVERVVELMRAHLFERTEVGIKIHVFDEKHPSRRDLVDPNDDDD
jgi:hypothetical protein